MGIQLTNVILKNELFTYLRDPSEAPELVLQHGAALEGFEAALHGTPKALQLSASLVRIGWTPPSWSGDKANFELQLSGKGMRPISSLNNLINAIDDGLATGGITSLVGLRNGVEILRLDFSTTAWTLSSGGHTMRLGGTLPVKFQTIFALEALLSRVDDIDLMTPTQRAAYFQDLSAYGVSSLTVTAPGEVVFQFLANPTEISLSFAGLVLTAKGTFPSNLGTAVSTLWEAGRQMDTTGSVDLSDLNGMGLTRLTVATTGGTLLVEASDFGTDGMRYSYAGRNYGEWQVAQELYSVNYLQGGGGGTRSVLTGLNGNDWIEAYGGDDAIQGGDGHDTIFAGEGNDLVEGGAGFDRVVYVSNANLRVNLGVTGGQVTGQGTDTLTGIEAVTTAGGADVLRGDRGDNMLNALGGADLLEGEAGHDTLIGGTGNDTLVGMRGNDVMYGGLGADVFRFYAQSGVVTPGHDVILDFDPTMDRLTFTANGGPAPWTGMTRAQFVSSFVDVYYDPWEGDIDARISISADQSVIVDGITGSLQSFYASIFLL